MSVPAAHTDQTGEAVPQSTTTSNWTINVSDMTTVKVSNVSLAATERTIREFFSFSGEIQYVEMQRESETTQLAYVTFKESQGADMAILLSGSTIADLPVTITPAKDYKLPPEAVALNSEQTTPVTESAIRKAEDMVSTMLAKGFVLGKDAIGRAKALDEHTQITANASATVASIDIKMGISQKFGIGTAVVNEKVREMNERFHVSEITRSAFSAAEQKASSAGSAIMSNHYVSTGASWVSGAFSAVAKAAGDVSMMTKEKVDKAEEGKRETLVKENPGTVNNLGEVHIDKSPTEEPPVVPIDSADSKLANI